MNCSTAFQHDRKSQQVLYRFHLELGACLLHGKHKCLKLEDTFLNWKMKEPEVCKYMTNWTDKTENNSEPLAVKGKRKDFVIIAYNLSSHLSATCLFSLSNILYPF